MYIVNLKRRLHMTEFTGPADRGSGAGCAGPGGPAHPSGLVLALPDGLEGGAVVEQGTGCHDHLAGFVGHRDLVVLPGSGAEVALQAGLVGDFDVPELGGAAVGQREVGVGLALELPWVFRDPLGGVVGAPGCAAL